MKGIFARKRVAASNSPSSSPPSSPVGIRKTASFGANNIRSSTVIRDAAHHGGGAGAGGNTDEEAFFANSSSSNDNSRFFSNNIDIDYNQNVESYGDLIHPKELQEEKPSAGPIRNKESILSGDNRADSNIDKFDEVVMSRDEIEWMKLMALSNQPSETSDASDNKKNAKTTSSSTISSAADSIDKEGWLTKEGRIVKSWKKRWFVLSGKTLSYYTDSKKNKKKGSILLDGAKINLATTRGDSHAGCLSLIAHELSEDETTDKHATSTDDDGARTLYFDAEDEKERHLWFVAINNKISVLNYQKQVKRKRLNPDLRILNFFDLADQATSLDLAIELDNRMTHNLKETIMDVVLAIREPIKYHKSLTCLNLNNCCMGDANFIQLCNALSNNTSITELRVEGNELTSESMKSISQVLLKNSSLKIIHFDHNAIDDEGMAAFCKSLSDNATSKLEHASFNYNKIGDEGISVLCNMLVQKKNQFKWKSLHVSHNSFGDEGTMKIADILLKNDAYPSLTELHLGWNKIKNDGGTYIANALKTNKSLKLLDLEYNKIEYDGIKALAFMIVDNHSIDTIILGGNKLGEQAVVLLASTDMNFPELELSTKLSNADADEDN